MAHTVTLSFLVWAWMLLPASVVSAQPTPCGQARPGTIAPTQGAPRGPLPSERELLAEIAASPTSTRAYLELVQRYRTSDRIEDADALLRSGIAKGADANPLYELLVSLYSPTYHPEKVLSIAADWLRATAGVRPLTTIANAHLELAKRLRPTSRQEAMVHLDDARRAARDARLLDADNVFVLLTLASVARTSAEFESDPARRAQLVGEAEALTRQAQEQAMRAGNAASGTRPRPAPPSGVSVGAVTPNAPLRVRGSVRPPVKIKDVPPVYPPEARDARVQGVVIAEIAIGADGKVTDARVLRSIPMLDQAALDAVRQWEFEPTLHNGQAVPIVLTVTVPFRL